MQSRYFNKVSLRDDQELAAAVRGLAAVNTNVLGAALALESELLELPSRESRDSFIEQAAAKLSVSQRDIRAVLDGIEHFVGVFSDPDYANDSPESLARDINQLGLELAVPERILPALTLIRDRSSSLYRQVQLRAEPMMSLPSLKSLVMRINYRPVFARRYKVYSDVDSYNPEVIGMVPVVTATIKLDSGPVEEVAFQMNRRNVRALIGHLHAVEKEFRVADGYVRNVEGKD